jgi:hypothetical protein
VRSDSGRIGSARGVGRVVVSAGLVVAVGHDGWLAINWAFDQRLALDGGTG